MNRKQAKRPELDKHIAIAELSDTGCKREKNEDCTGTDLSRGVAVLADGMGGHKGGEIASELAVRTVLEHMATGLDATPAGGDTDGDGYCPESRLAREAIEKSNAAIHDMAVEHSQYQGMGTTIVVTVLHDDRISICHVGDSRVYRLRDGELELLTRDHTLMQELIERGFYTPEEARESLNRNIVTRALGIEPDVTVDIIEDMVLPDDVYLLCSDGLNDMVKDEEIRATLVEDGNRLNAMAQTLVDQANSNGGNDNVSVVLVRALAPFPAQRSWFRRFADWFQ